MIKRTKPFSNVSEKRSHSSHTGGLPVHLRPEVWLNLYIYNGEPTFTFYISLLECTVGADIAGVLKCLPSNLFGDFKETLVELASIEREEDFVIVGSTPPSPLRLQDILRVIHWLEENPNPELAPPVED
ncbi:hypothetical protein EI77_04763 [Prosthecobacter fusiformis]|uniref:Uncharacterized protein n=1 Tax=Prosthecobacter fusiformis TaxID=48464 RepID=A0A4R7RJ62_9BACT|nr:hypothetical protein [Prosthecobacter fusiformis]TDU62081.1 hypothetical protein EI77_04763 [Prosthecobacter fusiformis]